MTNEQIRQEVTNNSIEFCVRLRTGQLGDFRRYMTADLQGIGVNGQALCVQLAANLEARQKAIPEVSDYIEAWMSCYENGLLVEISQQPAQQQPQRGKTAIEQQAEIIAQEIELQRKQRRQDAWKPTGPSMREKAEQIAKDEADWQSFKLEIGTAQTINVIGYQGNIDWGQTNDARRVAIRQCKDNWIKKCPNLAEKIQQYSTTAPTTSGGFVPLPLNASVQAMKQATPEQLRDLTQRQRAAKLPQSEPDNDV